MSEPTPEIPDRYDPTAVETHWYPRWEERGYFRADPAAEGKPFAIAMPPPNVTGSLHWGHALTMTLQDTLTRMKRMDGFNTLWLPGTDHAAIAVHVVLERQLAAEGQTKEDLGRDGFLARAWKWKEETGGTIVRQLRRLGASCDWSRERFTMDPGLSRAVRESFVRLWEEGLIYRDDYIVNWCPRCQTVLSDLEVEREERDGEFVYIKYGPVTLGTVRPETKLGDTGLAVHPKDKRYRHLVGQTLEVPSVDGTITVKVVADEAVDPKFGTGVIKVTPGHDPVDFEIGRRHNLPIKTVIGFDGKMTAEAGRYAGLDRFECRRRIVEDMKALGLIEKIEPYRHAVGICYRSKTVVEPLVSKQWYVQVKPLAEAAIKAVRERRITIFPRSWTKTYYHWMENIRPWCISRQLWWGHRIPAWHCDADGSVHVSKEDLHACPKCGGALRQDPDTLDTWFSSGLWPFSTLGWPDDTADLRTYYPTSVLVTGPDILFFWLARMAMLRIHFMNDVPFCDWYLEIAKLSLYHAENPGQRARTQTTLVRVLETTLRLLHPFMPFITEEIWQRLPHKGESIMLAPYPRPSKKDRKPDAELQMSAVMDLVTAVRNIRGEMRIAPAASLAATLRPGPDAGELFTANGALIDALGRVRLTIDPAATRPRSSAMAVIGGSELYVDLTGVVDLAAERQRIQKEIAKAAERVEFLRGKLSKPDFAERAPAEIVAKERERLVEQEALHAKLVASLGWVDDAGR